MNHTSLVQSLRTIADLYETHPDLPLPTLSAIYVFPDKEHLQSIARSLGDCKKAVDDSGYFMLQKQFGPVRLEFNFHREDVCERVVLRQEQVEEKIPVAYETRTLTKDVIEWRCPKSLLGTPAETEATTEAT